MSMLSLIRSDLLPRQRLLIRQCNFFPTFRGVAKRHFRPLHTNLGGILIKAGTCSFLALPYGAIHAHCDASKTIHSESNVNTKFRHQPHMSSTFSKRFKQFRKRFRRFMRMFMRALKISLTMTPVILLYPIHLLIARSKEKGDHDETKGPMVDWWFDLLLYCVESNGAALIKLMQWASSRPDIFGQRFCDKFQKLQDDTTPHSWKHTQEILARAYGDDWEEHLKLEPKLLGSGCIGQVYKGRLMNHKSEEQEVAVKVLHPNIRAPIDADLDLLRFAAYLAGKLPGSTGKKLQWLNLDGMAEEFAGMLSIQLDLTNEARHLERFNKNFAGSRCVKFPKLVSGYEPKEDVLVETFEEGVSVQKFAKDHADDKELLRKMCRIGIETICRMIFNHNFIHSDLHPGNIMVQEKPGEDPKFVLLDVGMVTEFDESEYETIVDILASFVKSDGRRAGELMISDSHRRMMTSEVQSENAEKFIAKIEVLTTHDQDMKFFENIGGYIRYLCDAASTHHVKMNQAFASIALTVKVQEGVALSLDPEAKIWYTANPIILETELRRRILKSIKKLFNSFGFDVHDTTSAQSVKEQMQEQFQTFLKGKFK